MADFNHAPDDHCEIFDFDPDESIKHNGRKSVRYVRNDIKVVLVTSNLLGIGKKIKAKLQDISSKGVRVSTDEKLGTQKKLIVALKFNDGTTFTINAKIVRKNALEYGIKFEQQQNKLGDYLLETQTDLLFK